MPLLRLDGKMCQTKFINLSCISMAYFNLIENARMCLRSQGCCAKFSLLVKDQKHNDSCRNVLPLCR